MAETEFKQFLENPCFSALRWWVARDIEAAFTVVTSPNSSHEDILMAQGAISKLEWILNNDQVRAAVCDRKVREDMEKEMELWNKVAAHVAAIEKELTDGRG